VPWLRSHPVRAVLVGLMVVVAVLGVAFRQQVGDVYGYLFPDGIADEAADRTAPPAPVDEGAPAPPTTRSAPTGAPAPAGPPRVALQPLVELDQPSALVDPAGPGPVVVSTLDGRVHEIDLATGSTRVLLDLRDRVSTGGERGLLGLALSPEQDRLYLNLTDPAGDTEVLSIAFADGTVQGGPGDLVSHLRIGQPYRNHNGGHLAFGPDGALWIGTGDGGSAGDPADLARDVDQLLGKMLRVVPDRAGGVRAPASNPDWGGRPEIWAIGLRNPWRYSFDRETGRLWVADVGQDAVEEVTVVDPSADRVDFGWDLVEGTRRHEGEAPPGHLAPVLEYGHDEGCSVTGGYVYRGEAIPALAGWYLFGDFCGGWIRAVPSERPGEPPTELVADAGPVISFAELEDGELLVLGSASIASIVAA